MAFSRIQHRMEGVTSSSYSGGLINTHFKRLRIQRTGIDIRIMELLDLRLMDKELIISIDSAL
jgi:hypothetical protein